MLHPTFGEQFHDLNDVFGFFEFRFLHLSRVNYLWLPAGRIPSEAPLNYGS
jgi:hypothetical protein